MHHQIISPEASKRRPVFPQRRHVKPEIDGHAVLNLCRGNHGRIPNGHALRERLQLFTQPPGIAPNERDALPPPRINEEIRTIRAPTGFHSRKVLVFHARNPEDIRHAETLGQRAAKPACGRKPDFHRSRR